MSILFTRFGKADKLSRSTVQGKRLFLWLAVLALTPAWLSGRESLGNVGGRDC